MNRTFFANLLVVSMLAAMPALAQQKQNEVVVTPEPGVQATTSVNLPLNKSRVFRVNQVIGKVAVGNPDIVDALALTDRSFYVLGKGIGTTNIVVFGAQQQLLTVIDVIVGADLEGIKQALHAMLPTEKIEVYSINNSIALSGVVSSATKVNEAMEIARRFSGKDTSGKDRTVINQIGVRGSQQVMLEVKVAEMDRSLNSAFGFHPAALIGSVNNLTGAGLLLSLLNTSNLSTSLLGAAGNIGKFNFSNVMEALEQKGAVKILAEPTLVALSGDTANFLAGGEFPVPVAQTGAGLGVAPTVTIEFKPFGVSLAFTPTVLDNQLINLIVAPEVSEIDTTNSVNENGFVIPGISTRRAKTSVELHDGESFAIAGLLSENFTDQVQAIPGISKLPILGALFRDSNFQRNQTELVIIVTPRLAQPVPEGTLRGPTDTFVPPSNGDIFWNGLPEAPDSGRNGGLVGPYGHIIQ